MKTSSRRQLTLILCVLSASLMLIGVCFRLFLNRTLYKEQIRSLESTAVAAETLVEAYPWFMMNSRDLRMNLAVAAASSGNDILLCDGEGSVWLCATHVQGCDHTNYQLTAVR